MIVTHSADRLARVRFTNAIEPGNRRLVNALREDDAASVLNRVVLGIGDGPTFAALSKDPAEILKVAGERGIRFVIPGDEEWPAQLNDLDGVEHADQAGMPYGLWVRGPLRLNKLQTGVAIVGARAATTYGTQVASDFAAAFTNSAHTVVSGGAFGIDAAAHRGALTGGANHTSGGPTVAVLACGADRAYPTAHRSLLDRIAEEGAVVSEVGPGLTPTRTRFLARNRIVAALTTATVVVEAGQRSGTLNTCRWASRLGRPLFGVPGPVTSATSAGVHDLIRQGVATLVSDPAHVIERITVHADDEVEV